MKQKSIRIAMGIICFVLALAITVQIRTMKLENSVVSQSFANDELKDSLLKWKEKYEKASEKLSESSKELENVRKTSTANESNAEEKTEQINKNNILLGLTKVNGEGVTVTLKDGIATLQSDDVSSLLIHDGD